MNHSTPYRTKVLMAFTLQSSVLQTPVSGQSPPSLHTTRDNLTDFLSKRLNDSCPGKHATAALVNVPALHCRHADAGTRNQYNMDTVGEGLPHSPHPATTPAVGEGRGSREAQGGAPTVSTSREG